MFLDFWPYITKWGAKFYMFEPNNTDCAHFLLGWCGSGGNDLFSLWSGLMACKKF